MAEKLVDVIGKLSNILLNMFLLLFPFFSLLLLCSLFRLKQLFKVKNGLTTLQFFFLENAKTLGRSDDAKRRKKQRIALPEKKKFNIKAEITLI